MPRILEALRRVDVPSFLTVVKRLGPVNPAPLSFPPRLTLAADVSASVPALFAVLEQLAAEVAEAGGRLFMAKDSRQSAAMVRRSNPRPGKWERIRARMDPRSQAWRKAPWRPDGPHA